MAPLGSRPLLSTGLAVGCLVLAAPRGAAQQTWYVDVNGTPPGSGTQLDPFASVQHAVDQPTTLDGDTLLVLPGTYAEVIDFVGKAITVLGRDGAAATILQGDPLASPPASTVTFASGEGPGSVLEGFTVRGGNGTSVSPLGDLGGGVFVSDANPTLTDCVVRENEADFGGGAALVRSSPDLSGCTFERNVARNGGGGLYFDDWANPDPVVQDCAVLDNVVLNGPGGGVYVGDFLPIFWDCTFSGNQSLGLPGKSRGGGLYLEGGFTLLQDCLLAGNSAGEGGAAYLLGSIGSTFRRSTLQDNSAAHFGGGVYAIDSFVDFEGCTLARNHALAGSGGGAIFFETTLRMSGCVLDSNDAYHFGGGFEFWASSPSWTASVDRCTLYGNTAQSGGGIYGLGLGTVTNSIAWNNVGGNLPGGLWTVRYSDVTGGHTGTGNIDADPLFWDPTLGDFELRPGSPCIDAGDPTSPPDPDGSVADMGAFPHDPSHCPPATSYCTAGATSNGCTATMSGTGAPSVAASSGFVVTAAGVEGQKQGILFFGHAPSSIRWGRTFRCVAAPLQRTGTQSSGGTSGQCDGTLAIDFNSWMQSNPAKAPALGEVVYMQAWFRDPPSAKTTSFSDGLRFTICP